MSQAIGDPTASGAVSGGDGDEPAMPAAPIGWRRIRRSIWRNKLAFAGLCFLGALVVVAIFAPWIAPYDFSTQHGIGLQGPSGDHWLGTDGLGRDTFSRLVYASRVSLRVSVTVVLLSLVVAVPLGLLAGYRGGITDTLLMRVAEAGLSFPPLVLALAVASLLGSGTGNATWAISVVFIPGLMRVVRGQALAVRRETFVEASRAIGTRDRRIIFHRVFPSVASPVIVQATVYLGNALLAEAALSYLGLGTDLPTPSWGNMLREAYDSALFLEPAQLILPATAIVLTVLAFNSLGDGLRDAVGLAHDSGAQRIDGRRGITTVTRERTGTPAPAEPDALLEIRGLSVQFGSGASAVRVIDDLDLTIRRGEVLGVVGESGSGKTVTAMSIMRLLPSPPAQIVAGEIMFDGRDLLALPFSQMRKVRGNEIAMIFQDPMSSLDPSFTIGSQLVEVQRLHHDVSRGDARRKAAELLDMVGIAEARRRIDSYPHELSGGMRQRVMIAMALANRPKLLIADEPTTALDVTVQAQILQLLRDLQAEIGMALMFVTHDLGVIADIADRVAVMYAGQLVEQAPVEPIFETPRHPYSSGLLSATPQMHTGNRRLTVIPGVVPIASAYPTGCRFHNRCPHAEVACTTSPIPLTVDGLGSVRCRRLGELELVGAAMVPDGEELMPS
jgi:peptide/nickel transport system permease protein